MGLVIKNADVINAGERFEADVRIDGGVITDLGSRLEARTGDETLDAAGQHLLPGFIDPHVHMELGFMGTVSADDFEVGGGAGAAGGTTCFIDFCIPAPGESMLTALATWKQKSAKAAVDHSYHMAITSLGRAHRRGDARGRPGARDLELQSVHGLQGRDHGGRCRALLGDARGRQAGRGGHGARRER